jgi:type II pantothenate kinase
LPQLREPRSYRPCDWDLRHDPAGRAYWVKLFCQHLRLLERMIRQEYPGAGAAAVGAFSKDYLAILRAVHARPAKHPAVDILLFASLRQELLNRHGFPDPFRGLKARENEAALGLLPGLLSELEALPAGQQVAALAQGLMAGNIFDLGAPPAIERYDDGQLEFRATRTELAARTWLANDLARWRDRWPLSPCLRDGHAAPPRHVLMFVDNAGSDICLGALPLVRWMLLRGARIVLAANSAPALNDITAPELAGLLEAAGALDPVLGEALAAGRLTSVGSGGDTPLLDLAAISPECAAAAEGADLVILHGMGRSVESNALASFTCDVLRTAVLKDPAVAARAGGRVFDCVFRFTERHKGTQAERE